MCDAEASCSHNKEEADEADVASHQFYLSVLLLHAVTFGFVWFAGCGCLECSCWGGSSIVCSHNTQQHFLT
jgi:hypothetical protein